MPNFSNALVAFDALTGASKWSLAGHGGRGMGGSSRLEQPDGCIIASGNKGISAVSIRWGDQLTIADAHFSNAEQSPPPDSSAKDQRSACYDLTTQHQHCFGKGEGMGEFTSHFGNYLYALTGLLQCIELTA